ncbi:MAG: ice-binding family protein [Solirubrobacteraceae bacterium]|jgi:hypothetical protein
MLSTKRPVRRTWKLRLLGLACLSGLALLVGDALAAQPPVGLGTDGAFAVLAGQAVTNTGPSVINGDLGVSPGSAVTGFPPGTVVNGTIHTADAVAAQAQLDLTTAYNDAAGRTPFVSVPADLTGLTLTPGVYRNASALGLTGALTLNAQGNASAVFIFQAGSTLITGSGSSVNLINGAQPCNVFWQVGSSATLGTTTSFVGNILALSSISMNNGVTLNGRALARNGSVTLINDTITAAQCATPATTTGTGGGTGSGSGTTTGTGGAGAQGGAAVLKATPSSLTKPGSQVCVSKAFEVTVSGRLIRRVVFSFAGHVVATRTTAPFTVSVDPGTGTHTLRAHVTFSGATPSKTLHIPVKSCNAADRSVKPLAGSGGFTG